jgi:hypothetical protein
MHDDEQQFIGLLRHGDRALQREQLVELQVRGVCDVGHVSEAFGKCWQIVCVR